MQNCAGVRGYIGSQRSSNQCLFLNFAKVRQFGFAGF